MEYLPSTQTTISLVISVGIAFILGKSITIHYGLSTYFMILIQISLVIPLYYGFSNGISALYRYITGYNPAYVPPQTTVTPNIIMFPTSPQAIPTDIGTGSKPIIPASGGTTATSTFGTSFLMTINTTIANPASGLPAQIDYAPLLKFRSIPVNSSTPGQPVMTIGYMPEGNLLQSIFFEGGTGDSLDIPTGESIDSRITIGTPPVKKTFAVFIRTRPASPQYTTVEIYVNGVLGKSATVRSLFFGGASGGIIPEVGYNAQPDSYPVVDAELQSVMVWGDASALTISDIQKLATQQMSTLHESRHTDTSRCK